jgi:outer membrane biosynthesis protein TonB
MEPLASLLLKLALFALCVYVPVSGCPDPVTDVARDSWAWTAIAACAGGAIVPFEPTIGILVMTLAFIVRMYAEACVQGPAPASVPRRPPPPLAPPRDQRPPSTPAPAPSRAPQPAPTPPPPPPPRERPPQQAPDPFPPEEPQVQTRSGATAGATAKGAEDMYRALAAESGFLSDADLSSMQSNSVDWGAPPPPPALGPSSYTAQGDLKGGAPEPISS